MTSVKIIDFNYVHYVNAEVEVLLPEESGIVQIEVQPCAHPVFVWDLCLFNNAK